MSNNVYTVFYVPGCLSLKLGNAVYLPECFLKEMGLDIDINLKFFHGISKPKKLQSLLATE